MAHIGWLRTTSTLEERGGALVTGFCLEDFTPTGLSITETELWDNYTCFLKAVVPHAEKHNIRHAIYDIMPSPNLGVTMCQATFAMMGEDLFDIIPRLADRIFFVHFRNTIGTRENFRETFHDNGMLPMAKLIRLYKDCGIDCPIRVDHVPTMAGEEVKITGYDAIGRLYAIGYLKGLLEAVEQTG